MNMNIALSCFMHNHGNIATEGSSKPGLCPSYSYFESLQGPCILPRGLFISPIVNKHEKIISMTEHKRGTDIYGYHHTAYLVFFCKSPET